MDLSLYIHIPFCVQKCLYCDFASTADSTVTHDEYVSAVIREMEIRSLALPEPAHAETLYIGGGTPSLLAPLLVDVLVSAARRHYSLAANAEVTLEANPGTVTGESLAGYRAAGINRLSMGVQSLDDGMLSVLGRLHTAGQAREAVAQARSAGFGNVGIDLIHGLPGQTLPGWEDTLSQAVALAPEHISAYGLSIEEGTPFHAMLRKGEIDLPDEESAVRMLEMTGEFLSAAGYEHYEIANFARPGFRSRHNQCYWKRGNYLGFGAAAHSFLRRPGYGRRWENPADMRDYCSSAESGEMPAVGEQVLTREDARAESLFLGLRLLEGVSPARIGSEFGEPLSEAFPGVLERLAADGLVVYEGSRLRLTRRGLLLANRVFAAFV